MENKTPQDILDKAEDATDVKYNELPDDIKGHKKLSYFNGYTDGALSEREDMFEFMEWVEDTATAEGYYRKNYTNK